MLNAGPEHARSILEEQLVSELLVVLTHSNTDPILLTSLCYLAEQILKHPSVKNNPAVLQDKINKMQSCENLLAYLGMSKYRDLLKNTLKYNN